MIHSSLLSIQLIPHYLILAAIVIVAHWIWIFGINKYRHQSKISTQGYQTGGSNSNASSQYNATQEALIISKPALSEQFLVNTISGSTHETFNATKSEELEVSQIPAEEQEGTHSLSKLTQKQAELDIVSAIKALAEGKLDTDSFKTLQEIAFITAATDKRYPGIVEEIKDILTSPAEESKKILFII